MHTRAKNLTSIVLICSLGMGIGVELVGDGRQQPQRAIPARRAPRTAHACSLRKQVTSPASSPGAVARGPAALRWIKTFGTPKLHVQGIVSEAVGQQPRELSGRGELPGAQHGHLLVPERVAPRCVGSGERLFEDHQQLLRVVPAQSQTAAHAMFDLWFNNWSYEVMVQYDFSNDGPCQGSWPQVKKNVTFGGNNGVPTQAWHLVHRKRWQIVGLEARCQRRVTGARASRLARSTSLPCSSTWRRRGTSPPTPNGPPSAWAGRSPRPEVRMRPSLVLASPWTWCRTEQSRPPFARPRGGPGRSAPHRTINSKGTISVRARGAIGHFVPRVDPDLWVTTAEDGFRSSSGRHLRPEIDRHVLDSRWTAQSASLVPGPAMLASGDSTCGRVRLAGRNGRIQRRKGN